MKKLFLLLCIWATLPAVAQTSKELLYVIDASYLKQGSTYGQLGLHFNCYDSNNIALLLVTSAQRTNNLSLSPKHNSQRG